MENIRIQDDLYTYVNQAKLDELVIPDDMPIAGGFAALNTDVEKLMIGEFNAMCADEAYPNEYLARACTLFKLAKDVKRKKKHGVKPALKNLAILKKLGTLRSFNNHAKALILQDIAMPLNIMVEPNMKDTTHHCVMIQGASVILPDVSYYKNEQQRDAMLGMWSGFAKQVLLKAGHSEDHSSWLLANLATRASKASVSCSRASLSSSLWPALSRICFAKPLHIPSMASRCCSFL